MNVNIEDCKIINFYGKFPLAKKLEILKDINVSSTTIKYIETNHKYAQIVYDMSEKNAERITDLSDDFEYFTILHLWNDIISPLRDYIQRYKLFEKYPEFLI